MVDPSVADLALFSGCTDAERERAARLLHTREVAAGDVVIESGEGDRRLIVVVSGRLRVLTQQGVAGDLGPGDVVGEIALLDHAVHNATVTAATDAVVLVADAASFERLRRIGDVGRRLRAVADARVATEGRTIVEASTVPIFVRPPRLMGRGAGLVARSDRRHRPVRVVVLGLLLLAVVGVAAFLVVGNASTPVPLEDVMARYAAGPVPSDDPWPGAAEASPSSDPALAPTPPGAADPLTAPIAVVAPQPAPSAGVPDTGAPGVTPDAPPSSAPGPPRPYAPPAPGVYTYATTGGESISVPNGEHRYPSQTYGAVRLGDGCGWSVEHWILEEHTEVHRRCSEPGHVLALLDGRTVSFFGKRQDTTYRCDPPATLLRDDLAAGSTRQATCGAENGDRARYASRYEGTEERRVGEARITTQRIHLEARLEGSVRGTSTVEFWLDAATGLVVREERTTRADVDSELGTVRYTEDATFELVSMTPRV